MRLKQLTRVTDRRPRPDYGRAAATPQPQRQEGPSTRSAVAPSPYAKVGKRALDLVFVACSAPLALALSVPIACWNLIVFRDPRQVLFKQRRVGHGGRLFWIYKFRTMREVPLLAREPWSIESDVLRTTTFGRFLRNTHLDELPQLFNVLRGDMSIVGPRPEMLDIHRWACVEVPGFAERLQALPGLTGRAQITQGYTDRTPEDYRGKLEIDRAYMASLSLAKDLEILARTVRWVLCGRGWAVAGRGPLTAQRPSLVQRLDERCYPGVTKHWDDELFRERILGNLRPTDVVLDVGAGAGIVEAMRFRGSADRVCGVDLDPRVVDNPHLDEGRVADGAEIPYPDASFDVVFSDNVLEHLEDPEAVFGEVARVLRPGGRFLAKTPNAWHYVPLVARLTPLRFHRALNRRRGRNDEDTFPTRYRANSARSLRRLARATGLEVVRIERTELRPEYTRIHPLAYLCGIAYERLVNSTELLAPFRVSLVCVLRKPATSPRAADLVPRDTPDVAQQRRAA